MEIKKVTFENVKGVKHADFNPAQINVFIGENGSGKSSYLSAIKGALTGDIKNPIRKGEKEASLELTMSTGQKITREFKKGKSVVKVDDKPTTQKSVIELLEDMTGVKLDTMKLLTSANMLSTMKSGDLANFLITNGFVPAELNQDKVMGFLTGISEEGKDELKMYLPSMPRTFGMDTIEDIHDELKAQRMIRKKELQTYEAKALWEKPFPSRPMSVIDTEIASLQNLSNQEKTYLLEMDIYNKEVEKREKMLKEIATLEEELSGLELKEPDMAKKEGYNALMATLRTEVSNKTKTLTVLEGNIALFEKSLETLSKPTCPLSEKLVCSTDKTAVSSEIEEQLQAAKKEQERLGEEVNLLNQKIEELNDKIKEFDQELLSYQKVQGLFDRHKLLKESLGTLPSKPEKPEIPPSITEKLELLKKERDEASAFLQAKEAEKKVFELETRITILDELVKALNPKGEVYAEILKCALSPLTDYCNDRAKTLSKDFVLGIEAEDGIKVTCKVNGGEEIELSQASSGEQLLASFLIMDMMNGLSGFGILLLDDLDKLDERTMKDFLSLLDSKEVRDSYNHIFIAAVNHEDTVKAVDAFRGAINTISLS